MLGTLLGNKTAALVLLFLDRNEEVYATKIATGFGIPVNMVQKQLDRFERGGVIRSDFSGRRKIYKWNAAYPFYKQLRSLLSRANALGPKDAADGSFLSIEERVKHSDSLRREAEKINPCNFKPIAKSFGSFELYEKWRKKQKNPWF